jgi:hypothetical protein
VHGCVLCVGRSAHGQGNSSATHISVTYQTRVRQSYLEVLHAGVQGVLTSTAVAATCVRKMYVGKFVSDTSQLAEHHCLDMYSEAST